MKRYYFILIAILFFSCKKAEDRTCFKGTGDESERIIYTQEDVDTLFLYDDIYYTLEQSNETKVVLTGGENLLSHIDVEIQNGKLTMTNNNKCRFLRSYKNKIYATVFVDSVKYIHYEGVKEMKSKDTLFSNELRVYIRDGAGSTDLTLVNGYTSVTVTHGFGDFTLRGKSLYANLYCNTNSYCDTRSFQVANDLIVKSNTVGKMLINANNSKLFATIMESGNIEYVGIPFSTTLERNGKGKLIDLNN